MMPAPVQAAMVAALGDDAHVAATTRGVRRATMHPASRVRGRGIPVDGSEAGLYLWVTRGEECWETIAWLADRGILAAPGAFYGDGGGRHVRVALTAADERIQEAVRRLAVPR